MACPSTGPRLYPSIMAMKLRVAALLAAFLCLTHLRAASPAGSLGSIVSISGKITGVDKLSGSIRVGGSESYYVTANSVLTVNGRRGSIADLTNQMNASGSAEIAKGETRFAPQKKIIRMLTATTDPASERPVAAATPSARTPPGGPIPPARVLPSPMEDASLRLAGTFWSVPDSHPPVAGPGSQWVSLNGNGTTTSSESDTEGKWGVIAGTWVQLSFYVGEELVQSRVTFNHDFSEGMVESKRGTAPTVVPWKRIATPTNAMLAKVPSVTATPALPGQPAPPSPKSVSAASAIMKANTNNLVFVTGKEGAGSGFIANMDGANYLVTNAHVAAGIDEAYFKTLDGTVVPRGPASVAVGHDVFRMAQPAGGRSLEIMSGVDQNASVDDEVVVLGNAEGAGVINTIMGKIVGIGPNLVEVDAPFVPGNSGSPIIHLKTGKVIGVATFAVIRRYDAATMERTKEPVVRRFGYRLDSVKLWQPVSWQSFHAQALAMERIHTLSEALDHFLRDLFEHQSHVTISQHTNPIIKTRIAQWQESKSRKLSPADREIADANFISFLKVACQTDLAETQRFLTYDYFQRKLGEEQGMRSEMAKAFTEIIWKIRE